MAISYVATLRNTRMDAVKTAVDAGSGAGVIKVYAGSIPANADAALGGATLLGTLTFSDPSFPAASSGVITASAITQDSSADATGTATFFRVETSAAAVVMQGTAGTSGTDMILNTASIVAGGPIACTSFVLTHG